MPLIPRLQLLFCRTQMNASILIVALLQDVLQDGRADASPSHLWRKRKVIHIHTITVPLVESADDKADCLFHRKETAFVDVEYTRVFFGTTFPRIDKIFHSANILWERFFENRQHLRHIEGGDWCRMDLHSLPSKGGLACLRQARFNFSEKIEIAGPAFHRVTTHTFYTEAKAKANAPSL